MRRNKLRSKGCLPPPGPPSRPEAIQREVDRRRTFAIISHPDAGKTTLTEKLLLYGGAVSWPAPCAARKTQRHATSDWMDDRAGARHLDHLDRAAVRYEGCRINLLDTPGHQDFSEDTYRTLTAVDSAVMVLDAAKGIEPQTRKLFEVCRQRRMPIFTFINKLDRPGRDPLELLDEIESVLGIARRADELADRRRRSVPRRLRPAHHRCLLPLERTTTASGARRWRWPHRARSALAELLGDARTATCARRSSCSDVLAPFDLERVSRRAADAGLLRQRADQLRRRAVPARPRRAGAAAGARAERSRHRSIRRRPDFTGFVFKIQANMDPHHRDRVAFLRVCSGRFDEGHEGEQPAPGRAVRLTRPHRFFGRERETVDEAYPGDVVGLVNPGLFAIGDTLCTGEPVRFPRSPLSGRVLRPLGRSTRPSSSTKVSAQLEEEGLMQVVFPTSPRQPRADHSGSSARCSSTSSRRGCPGEYGVQVPRRSAELHDRAPSGPRRRRCRPARSRRRPAATSPPSIARIASCCCSPRTWELE